MNENSKAILILCSYICVDSQTKPLEPKEWSTLATKLLINKLEPKNLLELNQEIIDKLELDEGMVNRINTLIKRSATLFFEINKYENFGIKYVTRADKNYPKKIKKTLGNSTPPIMYYCGNLKLLDKELVGFVGSRKIEDSDSKITEIMVKKTVEKGYGIVSGGAKGIDETSAKIALENDGFVVEIVSDSMLKKIKNSQYMNNVRNDKILICSFSAPNTSFNVGMAMMRNKFIYISSIGTIVIKSDYKKGGTWNGAIENIKNGYAPICVVENNQTGNQELIKLGAKAINEKWDYKFDKIRKNLLKEDSCNKKQNITSTTKKQLTLF